VLKHDVGKPTAFNSVKTSIEQITHNNFPTNFAVDWSVSPNALKGPATLALVGLAADGNEVHLYTERDEKVWAVDVDIGGDIEKSDSSYSDKLDDGMVNFFVEFDLSCQGKKLKGAQLYASVKFDNNLLHEVPVAVGADGQYQLSWSLTSKRALEGTYHIDVYRLVDKRRNNAVEPFLSMKHNHVASSTSWLPVRTEILILSIFSASFLWAYFRKKEIQDTKR